MVMIDHIQHFDKYLLKICHLLHADGIKVLLSGLLQEDRGAPFIMTRSLMVMVDKIYHLYPWCQSCSTPLKRAEVRENGLVFWEGVITPGGSEIYFPLCTPCAQEKNTKGKNLFCVGGRGTKILPVPKGGSLINWQAKAS